MPAPNIDGFWRNELDSQMELKVTGVDVCGTYKTAVGDPNAQRNCLSRVFFITLLFRFLSIFQQQIRYVLGWVGLNLKRSTQMAVSPSSSCTPSGY
jgi:hypothetical protein